MPWNVRRLSFDRAGASAIHSDGAGLGGMRGIAMFRDLLLLPLLASFLQSTSVLADDCYGPADLVADGVVDARDFSAFGSCLAGPGAPSSPTECVAETFAAADMDGDGDVDLHDLALFATSFGGEYFVYGPHRDDRDVELLAIEISGELRAPDALYSRIHGDLLRIREAYPETSIVQHRPLYHPTRLIVQLESGELVRVLEPLNRYYQADVFWSSQIFPGEHGLQFCDNLNMPLIATEYQQVDGVLRAEIGYAIGGGDWIEIEFFDAFARYTLVDGSGDCPAGCTCERVWIVDVLDTGDVTLVSYTTYGDCE